MFWNVENYFDPFNDPDTSDDQFTPSGELHWTWNRFISKRNAIAKTIISTADITGSLPALIGLAEVENSLVLKQLVKDSPLSLAMRYDFIHRDSPDSRGIDVALLYDRQCFSLIDTQFISTDLFPTREILYVKGVFKQFKDTSHIFVCHLPSKRGGAKKSQNNRDSVLSLLKHPIDSLLSASFNINIIVMGDFNDVNVELPVPEIPIGHGTLKYHGRWEAIDHFFTSSCLCSNAIAYVFSPPFLLENDKSFLGQKPRRTYIGPRYNNGFSDHLPIILKLNLVH